MIDDATWIGVCCSKDFDGCRIKIPFGIVDLTFNKYLGMLYTCMQSSFDDCSCTVHTRLALKA